MIARRFGIGDAVTFTTADSQTMRQFEQLGPAPMVCDAVVVEVYDRPGRWEYAIELPDGSRLAVVENELNARVAVAAGVCEAEHTAAVMSVDARAAA